jgi:hypothetical protein
MTVIENPQTAKTVASKRDRRMLGFDLPWWNAAMLVSLAVAAAAAVAVVVTTRAVIVLQDQEAKDNAEALERYKAGVAVQVADARKEGIQAGKAAGDALVRAAALEKEAAVLGKEAAALRKEAANARLETERVKAHLAWRTLSVDAVQKLEAVLKEHPGSVNLRYADGDPEALFLAIQMSEILARTGWAVASGSIKFANAIAFEIRLPDADGIDAQTLRKAFSAAAIPFSTEPLPPAAVFFSVSTIDNAPTLTIGSKRPSFP